MLSKYINEVGKLYKDDKKKLRTGTTLYGHLFDNRWQTKIHCPLTGEDVTILENEFGTLPNDYKELLQVTNGCYLFDLINIAGKQDGYKGLSHEEMVNTPSPIRRIVPLSIWEKANKNNLFVFATSMVNESFYVVDSLSGKVQEIKFKRSRTVQEYKNLEELLYKILEEGKELVESGTYIDFY
jgi:hypothetical protein